MIDNFNQIKTLLLLLVSCIWSRSRGVSGEETWLGELRAQDGPNHSDSDFS